MRKFEVVVLPMARLDVREARQWYNQLQKGLGKRFNDDMANTLLSVRRNPFSFAVRYESVRIANFKRFPFGAHFVIDEQSSRVHITAILHTSRNPNTSRERYPPGA